LKWAQVNNSRVIHFSTDCVFDGSSGQYTETSQPTAKDTYGKTKFLGEIEGDCALTLRFSCIGRELDTHTELLEWFLAQKNTEVNGFGKVIYSGLTTHVISREVVKIIVNFPNLTGIFQLSSSPISKYDLLCLIQEKYETSSKVNCSNDYVADKSLVCSKYVNRTKFEPQTWDKMIEDLHSDSRVNYLV
jgi:dTDP-4-dehydrorhamnose reductase